MWFVESELLSWHSHLMWFRIGNHIVSQNKESVSYGSRRFPKTVVWFLALLVRSAITATVINSNFQNLSKLDKGVAPWKSYFGRGKTSNITGSISALAVFTLETQWLSSLVFTNVSLFVLWPMFQLGMNFGEIKGHRDDFLFLSLS